MVIQSRSRARLLVRRANREAPRPVAQWRLRHRTPTRILEDHRGACRCIFLGVLVVALGALAAIVSIPSTASASTPPPGPCEDGYVAPTPTKVAVTSVPITVTSTTADYFVLYLKTGKTTTNSQPILVKRGEDGTTTLPDNLSSLSADKYLVEKYSVAQPGDLDGDCIDDVTELADIGKHNPINPAKTIDIVNGAVAIDSRATFQTLSFKGSTGVKGLEHLDGLEFVKFEIRGFGTDTLSTYFINSNTHKMHTSFDNAVGLSASRPTAIGKGTIVYYPNVISSDGSLGLYAFQFDPWNALSFSVVEGFHQLLATGMPFLDNKLYFHPFTKGQLDLYKQDKTKYDNSRVKVLLDKDIAPDVDFIPLNQAEGYGRLRLMAEGDRPSPFDVAIYDALPNDLPRVAGTITTVPQTPLSHVNLRAIQNGLPNAFIRDALSTDAVTSLIGSYVYYAVGAEGYTLRAATKADVDKHFEDLRPKQTQTLQRDLTKTTVTSLASVSFADWNAFGVKAANVAELTKLSLPTGTTPVGYAVPFYFYDEFMKQATVGKETILGKKKAPAAEKITLSAETTLAQAVSAMLAHSYFQSDSDIQEEMLDDLRKAIKNATSPTWVITALNGLHGNYPDGQSLRYRSSTNNEDLPSFNGAGLYDSKTQDPDETTADGIDKSIKAVWASLWNHRAFLERDFHRVDHSTVAMGVLVHPNYSDELVNGVAVSYDPITFQDNAHYVNSQVGEDLVTNPEAYSQPEQLLLGAAGSATVLSRSNLASSSQLLMSAAQMTQLRSNLDTIHNRFKTLYQVQDGDDFAIEIEFKITAANQLAIKQARPWIFPEPLVIANPEVSVALSSAQVTEGEPLGVTVTRSGGIQSTPLTVNLAWSETGAMLKSKPASVTIPGNQTSASVTVGTDDDQEDEHDSIATVSISSDSAYTIGTSGSASATIADNDQTMIGVRGDASTVTEGSSVGFTFTRSGSVLEQPLTVSVTITESESRLQGTAPTAVTFAANSASAAISLPTSDDSVRTNPSVVTVQIGAGSDYDIKGSGQAKVTIEEDEQAPPTLLFDFNHAVPEKETYILSVSSKGNGGAVSYVLSGPDRKHFTDYTAYRMIVMSAQQYNHSADANNDGVFEIDLKASYSGGGTTTERLRFTVVNNALINRAQQRWDQLSEDQRATLLPEVDADGLKPEFASLTDDVQARVLRLGRQQLLPSPGPTISIAAGGGVTEGSDATFTVSAVPSPAAALAVSVTISQSGDYGVSTGAQTISIPTSGSYTLTVSTTGDDTDEPDGSVTAAVDQGSGYVVSATAKSATVAVGDDDDAPATTPEISVAAGSGVTEGSDATFTITAVPAPTTALSVSVTVSQSGDFGVSTGARTVSIPTSGSYTLTVPTTGDTTDEPDGSVTATVNSGTGYTLSTSAGTATVAVADDDDPPPVIPEISVAAGSGVTEGSDATFTITAVPSPSAALSVSVTVSQSGDFGVSTGARTVSIPTSGSYTLTVPTTGDTTDEADGSVTATISSGTGYTVSTSAGTASVVVSDDDVGGQVTPSQEVIDACVSGSLLEVVRGYYEANKDRAPSYGRNWKRVLIAFADVQDSQLTAFTATEALAGEQVWFGWRPVREALECIEEATTPPPPADPEISITPGSGVTEGSDATFTVTASPNPTSVLTVNVTISQSGSFAATTGADTVTIPTTGSATFTVSTTNDNTDEPNGSVTATVDTGTGYTVSSSNGAATVAVADDDDPPPVIPEISVAAGSGVTEGSGATFTISAAPSPTAALSVSVTISQSGDYGASTGERTVSVPTSGSYTLTVPTTGDTTDEADGSVTATVNSGTGYTVSTSAGTASVVVSDDDVGGQTVTASQEVIDACVSGSLLEVVRGYYEANKDRAPSYGRNWKRVLIAFADVQDSQLTAFTATEALAGEQIWFGWKPVREALECIEEATSPPPADPEISITAGSGVTEGSGATFTITAAPSPAAALSVSVTISQSGDYGVSTGARTVSIPTSGSYTLTVPTTNDSTDEPDGSVTATLNSGTGYTVSTTASTATVAVADDDDPPPVIPEVSIAAGAGVTEGNGATFTITAAPSPAAALSVSVTISQSGDYGVSTGARTVSIPTTGTYTLTVPTTGDSTDEPDGSVTATISSGTGYTVSTSANSATVVVSDDDVGGQVTPSQEVIDACVSDSLLEVVRGYYEANKDRAPSYGRNWKRVLIAFADVQDSQLTAFTATEALAGEQIWFGWKPVREALECIEEATSPPPADPEISITAGSGVTEGSGATFTITAAPSPAAALSVSVTISQSGDYGVSTGARTVSIPTSGSYTLTVPTTNDSTDEPDGSVTATLNSGTGYTVSTTASTATVAVADDDDPPPVIPEVSIAAGAGVTEGNGATFTITAAPSPAAALSVSVTISQSGDYGVSTGARTVSIPTTGTYTLTVPTTGDSTDEPDGSVTATISSGTGYTVSTSANSATVVVSDDDVGGQVTPSQEVIDACVSDSLLEVVRGYYEANKDRAPSYGRNWKRVLIAFADVQDSQLTAFTATEALAGEQIWFGWKPVREALECIEEATSPPPADPEISITAGSAVTEGSDATFTVTASPNPTSVLTVNVTISQSGSFAATTGADTVTIPTTGSATFTVSTTNDTTDEPDGSVTATVDTGTGYTVSSSSGAATVAVADDDDPPPATPEISITAGSAVTEGSDATFTVTASPSPTAALTVNLTVSQSGSFAATTGADTVTIPTTGSATFTVTTTNDSTDEPDGSVTATIGTGTGYSVSSNSSSATVAVSDDDDAPPPSGRITVSVSDASASEGDEGLPFVVTLSRASTRAIPFRYGGYGQSAALGPDFTIVYEEYILNPGDTRIEIVVPVIDDQLVEGDETLVIYVYTTSGFTIPGYFVYANGTIIDDD